MIYVEDTASGLQYLHALSIAHRDLNLSSTLLGPYFGSVIQKSE